MANMVIEDGKFVLTQEIAGAGIITKTLNTENTFVDKNIDIVINTPAGTLAGGATTISATDAESILTEVGSAPASGEYITIDGQGSVSASVGGFIDEGTEVATVAATKYYAVQNATFAVDGPSVKTTQKGYVGNNVTVGTVAAGTESITGGALSEGAKSTAIESNGSYDGTSYDTTDKIKFESSEAAGVYKITSTGSATVNRAVVQKQVTSAGYFTADGAPVDEIAADSITVTNTPSAYYVKKSTLSASQVTASNVDQIVTIGEGYYPSERTITITGMTEVTPTTSVANVGMNSFFVTGTSSDNDVTLTPQYSNAAGYVSAHTNTNNGGVEYYKIKPTSITEGTTTVSGSTATRGEASWDTGWITSGSMDVATFANSGSSGVSYVNISDTTAAPVLVAGDYLYINKGYTDNLKISLAKLVPDGSDVKGHNEYILSGHSAYDNDGVLVAGSIPTYTGAYTVA
jgi:hypothetical protein